MANRYRNQGYGRGDYGRGDYEERGRRGSGRRSSEYNRGDYDSGYNRGGYGSNYGRGGSYGSDYGQERYGSDYGRGNYESDYGRGGYESNEYSDYDREENYYGGGRQYGQQMRGESGRYGSNDREGNDDYTTGSYIIGRSGYRNRGGRGGNYDRESYYGGGSFNEYGGGGTYGGYNDRSNYGRGYRNYSGDYPQSESGYDYEGGRGEDRGFLDKAADEVSSWFGDEEAERRREMDARRQGSHRGRGPRSYKRSDDRIKEDINDRLTDSDYLDASDIEVEVSDREVVLTGTVSSRYAKRLAEDLAEDVSGVTNVENRLRVNQSYYGQGGYSTSGSTTGTTAGTTGTSGTTDTTGTTSATGTTGKTTGTSETNETTGTTTTGKSRSKTA